MDCGHGSYQCGPPMMGQDKNNHAMVLVVMWCTQCGAITLRIPQINSMDERMAALRSGGGAQLQAMRAQG
jgi:hypothetical protein